MSAKKKLVSPEVAAPYPFRSSVHTSDEERRLLFTDFIRRMEKRHNFTRPQAITTVAIRMGRTPAMIYHWLSKAERNRPIPWAMLDLLMLEELMVEQNLDFGHDVLAMYNNPDRIIKSHSVAHVAD